MTKMNSRMTLTRRQFSIGGAAALAVAAAMPTRSQAQSADAMLWYSGSATRPVEAWADMFRQKTSLPIETYRAGSTVLIEKIEQEIRAKQLRASVYDIAAGGLVSQWHEQGLVLEYESPEASHFPADLRMAGVWTPINALPMSIAYNADHIDPEEAPKTWEDLLDPKWKGKMAMTDAFYSGAALHWFGVMRKVYGNAYVENLAKQDVLIRKGSGDTTNTIISGERPLAAMVHGDIAFAGYKRGGNIYLVQPEEGVPLAYQVIAIPADAPNPDAAKKFVDIALSKDGQQLWQDEFFSGSLRDDVTPVELERGRKPLKDIKPLGSSSQDVDELFKDQANLIEEWSRLFK